MTVSVLLEGVLKEGLVDEFVEICKGAYPVTRAYDGCKGINLTLNVDDSRNFVMTETWDSKEHYEKYLQWRVESGVMGAFSSKFLDEEPVWRYFDLVSEF